VLENREQFTTKNNRSMKGVSFNTSNRFNALNNTTARSNRRCGVRSTSPTGNPSVNRIPPPSPTRDPRTFVNGTATTSDGTDSRPHGFVDGNFSSGKVFDLRLPEKSYCIAYNKCADILAVGTATSLDFYDASNYCLIYSLHRRSMISALSWISVPFSASSTNDQFSDERNNQNLLAVSDLDGNILLFHIDSDILESQGPSLLYSGSNANGSQIRCLDAGYYHCLDQKLLVVAAGDKSGAVTIVTFNASQIQQQPIYMTSLQLHLMYRQDLCMEVEVNKSGVLGLSLRFDRGIVAVSSSSGLVQMISLSYILEKKQTTDSNGILWSHQNNGGSIRCVVFGDDFLAFGGYDKTVSLVDTQHWVISRELALQGTVRIAEYNTEVYNLCR
jgi:hypothetical protein